MVTVNPPTDVSTEELHKRPKTQDAVDHVSLDCQPFPKQRIVRVHRSRHQDEGVEKSIQEEDNRQAQQPGDVHASLQRIPAYSSRQQQEDTTYDVDYEEARDCDGDEEEEDSEQPRPHAQGKRRRWAVDGWNIWTG